MYVYMHSLFLELGLLILNSLGLAVQMCKEIPGSLSYILINNGEWKFIHYVSH